MSGKRGRPRLYDRAVAGSSDGAQVTPKLENYIHDILNTSIRAMTVRGKGRPRPQAFVNLNYGNLRNAEGKPYNNAEQIKHLFSQIDPKYYNKMARRFIDEGFTYDDLLSTKNRSKADELELYHRVKNMLGVLATEFSKGLSKFEPTNTDIPTVLPKKKSMDELISDVYGIHDIRDITDDEKKELLPEVVEEINRKLDLSHKFDKKMMTKYDLDKNGLDIIYNDLFRQSPHYNSFDDDEEYNRKLNNWVVSSADNLDGSDFENVILNTINDSEQNDRTLAEEIARAKNDEETERMLSIPAFVNIPKTINLRRLEENRANVSSMFKHNKKISPEETARFLATNDSKGFANPSLSNVPIDEFRNGDVPTYFLDKIEKTNRGKKFRHKIRGIN